LEDFFLISSILLPNRTQISTQHSYEDYLRRYPQLIFSFLTNLCNTSSSTAPQITLCRGMLGLTQDCCHFDIDSQTI
ncbi:MAG: hypothetical protein ACK53Y_21075, partial [bacterium]